jgi:hypothetical protein
LIVLASIPRLSQRGMVSSYGKSARSLEGGLSSRRYIITQTGENGSILPRSAARWRVCPTTSA